MTCVTAGTATAARAGFFGVNTHSSSSLSDSVTDVWPRRWRLLAGGVDGVGGYPGSSMVLVASRGRQLWYRDIGGVGG